MRQQRKLELLLTIDFKTEPVSFTLRDVDEAVLSNSVVAANREADVGLKRWKIGTNPKNLRILTSHPQRIRDFPNFVEKLVEELNERTEATFKVKGSEIKPWVAPED